MSISNWLCKIGLHNYDMELNIELKDAKDVYKCSRSECNKVVVMDHVEPFKCKGCEFSRKCK